jgi:hypothetical protein
MEGQLEESISVPRKKNNRITKTISGVVTLDTIDCMDMKYKIKASSSKLHKYTFGITSNPLTLFSVAFLALIHYVDHTGFANWL